MGIIIASSNLFRLELSAYLLSEAGYTVHEVHSAEALLRALDRSSPCLIVLDSLLDDGAALLGTVQERADVPVLVVGGVRPADLQALREHGGDAIGWPYQSDDLVALARTLKRRPAEMQVGA